MGGGELEVLKKIKKLKCLGGCLQVCRREHLNFFTTLKGWVFSSVCVCDWRFSACMYVVSSKD